MSHALQVNETVQISRVSHRLALGIQWMDALTRRPADGALLCDLEAIGGRALTLRFDEHQQSRHALRSAGRLASILKVAAADKAHSPPIKPEDDQTNFCLRTFAARNRKTGTYSIDQDPRQFVPRRLSLTPVQNNGLPVGSAENIRQAWLWPGAAYPLASNTTAIRGRIQQGPDLAHATPVPWVRVVVTLLGAMPINFSNEIRVGWGHGDDRGEFLVVLGPQAVPGGAILPQSLALRLWVFLPSAVVLDEHDPLASLPLEYAGTDSLNDVLRGIETPAGYTRQAPVDVELRPGEVLAMNDAVLLFP